VDPIEPVPAIGDARWLDARAPEHVASLLKTAAAGDSALVMMEVRHVGGVPSRRTGAVTSAVGPFIYHAVGLLGRSTSAELAEAFGRARSVWSAVDAGLTPGSWVEGAAVVPDALPPDVLDRARSIADAVDPNHHIARSRLLSAERA
jgi:enoyl-CoA hydratase/carnithine racemase